MNRVTYPGYLYKLWVRDRLVGGSMARIVLVDRNKEK